MAADRALLCGLVTAELLRLVAALAALEGREAELVELESLACGSTT